MDQLSHPSQQVTRLELRFNSNETYCSAWLYLPLGVKRPPVVVLGHGLGAIREMRLDEFAERFAVAGIAALAYTRRYTSLSPCTSPVNSR